MTVGADGAEVLLVVRPSRDDPVVVTPGLFPAAWLAADRSRVLRARRSGRCRTLRSCCASWLGVGPGRVGVPRPASLPNVDERVLGKSKARSGEDGENRPGSWAARPQRGERRSLQNSVAEASRLPHPQIRRTETNFSRIRDGRIARRTSAIRPSRIRFCHLYKGFFTISTVSALRMVQNTLLDVAVTLGRG